ncbi:MAG TPA: beta-Ig-H3/fasciclin [Planctomycetes bacterium]|nr:beta-Ig-H3/fasciclin [Planctomycetota bacterium]
MNTRKLLTASTLTALVLASTFPAALEARHFKPSRGTIVETAVAAGNFTTLVAALQATGLDEALSGEGPFTVFAPTDEAFSNLFAATGLTPEELLASPDLPVILTYHVVAGKLYTHNFFMKKNAETLAGETVVFSIGTPAPRRGLTYSVNDATIVAPNIRTSNGIIHAIDKVLLPPKDIVETAEAAGSFSVLIAALKAAGLEEALKGEGPFTVFAPTDAAFGALLATLGVTAEELLADPELASILLYHVVGGELYERDLRCTRSAETLQGGTVRFSSRGPWFMPRKDVYVNGVRVVASNVLASNGVIHVIDAVLLPPEE